MLLRLLLGVGLLSLTSSSLPAETLSIDHQAVGCVVAEKFPRLEARFAPADGIATARVVFQPEGGQHWYSVAMKADGAGFSGVLPKPRKRLKAYRYYIEVTDKALATNRTTDYTTSVAGSEAGCQGKVMASGLGSASVLLQAPAGAATLPAGFASAGVVVAGAAVGGGGLGTGAVVGIVAGGVGAAAAGVAVAAGGKDSSTPATSTPPTPTPTPTPAPIASVAGTWLGRSPDGWTTFEPLANCGRDVHDLDLVFTQTGTNVAGTMRWQTRESYSPSDVGRINTQQVTGTVSGNALTWSFGPDSRGTFYVASATFTSARMIGSVPGNSCPPMPFALNRQ